MDCILITLEPSNLRSKTLMKKETPAQVLNFAKILRIQFL